jgi:hypothetical protein
VAALLAFALVVLTLAATACHPWPHHIDSVHSDNDAETVCINMDTNDIDYGDVRDPLEEILWDNSHDLDWDAHAHIFVLLTQGVCEDIEFNAEVEVKIHDEGDYGECNPNVPCTEMLGQHASAHGSHLNYSHVRINLSATDFPGGTDLTITTNHEFGHALGFADPTPGPGTDPDAETCRIEVPNGRVVPVLSVMHAPYCIGIMPLFLWPTWQDFFTYDDDIR